MKLYTRLSHTDKGYKLLNTALKNNSWLTKELILELKKVNHPFNLSLSAVITLNGIYTDKYQIDPLQLLTIFNL